MTENDLKTFFTGSFQLGQAVAYLTEIIDAESNIGISYITESPNIIKVDVQSRHVRSKIYKSFVEYEPNSIGYVGINQHYCECPNGNRTVGCCSHVAAVIYYLSHARYFSKIIRLAEILSPLFITQNIAYL